MFDRLRLALGSLFWIQTSMNERASSLAFFGFEAARSRMNGKASFSSPTFR